MDLRQVRYFQALYEEHSITKAARRLNVVQPAVSMQLRKLESEFGVILFDRTPRGVFPNDLAKRLYPICAKMLSQLQEAIETLEEASGTITGSLSVGFSPSIAHGVLPLVLTEFCGQFPHVRLSCHEGYSAHLVEWVLQGSLDFAVVNSDESDRRLRQRPLVTETLVVVTKKSRELERLTSFPASGLIDKNVILPSSSNLLRILIDSALERADVSVTSVVEIDSLPAVLGMLRKPGWYSILPAMALRGLPFAKELTARPMSEPTITRNLAVAYSPAKKPSAAGQKFVEVLEKVLAS